MTLALGSVLLSLLNIASAALIAERRRAGWLVALAAQIPWTWYDLWTRQLGFLLLTLIYVPVYLRGWRKARNLALAPLSNDTAAAGRPGLTVISAQSYLDSSYSISRYLISRYESRPDQGVERCQTQISHW
jgi:hypothetical protein